MLQPAGEKDYPELNQALPESLNKCSVIFGGAFSRNQNQGSSSKGGPNSRNRHQGSSKSFSMNGCSVDDDDGNAASGCSAIMEESIPLADLLNACRVVESFIKVSAEASGDVSYVESGFITAVVSLGHDRDFLVLLASDSM